MTVVGVLAILLTIAAFLLISVIRDLYWPPKGDDDADSTD